MENTHNAYTIMVMSSSTVIFKVKQGMCFVIFFIKQQLFPVIPVTTFSNSSSTRCQLKISNELLTVHETLTLTFILQINHSSDHGFCTWSLTENTMQSICLSSEEVVTDDEDSGRQLRSSSSSLIHSQSMFPHELRLPSIPVGVLQLPEPVEF